MKPIVNLRKDSFNIWAAVTWWRSEQNELMSGHFNTDLYFKLMDYRLKNPNYEENKQS
jgi:hypothetical protein